MNLSINYVSALGTKLSGALDTVKKDILSHPTTQKIISGTKLVLNGLADLALTPSYLKEEKIDPAFAEKLHSTPAFKEVFGPIMQEIKNSSADYNKS